MAPSSPQLKRLDVTFDPQTISQRVTLSQSCLPTHARPRTGRQAPALLPRGPTRLPVSGLSPRSPFHEPLASDCRPAPRSTPSLLASQNLQQLSIARRWKSKLANLC